jgi:hypothetical protein
MSTVEERLARDIAAVTRGIVVTDSELLEARKALDERIHGRRAPGRLGTAVAAAAAVVVLIAAGVGAFMMLGDDEPASQPGTSPEVEDPDAAYLVGDAPTPQRIAGVWRLDNGRVSMRITQDGTVSFDEKGTLFSRPVTSGTYVIDGDLITITTTHDVQQTCVGTTYALRASLPAAGQLRFVAKTPPGACSPLPLTKGAWERVLPIGPSLADLVFSADTEWKPVSDTAVLRGVWMAEGGGHVLELDADGSYYIADDTGAPIDRGTWTFRSSELTLTSSVSSSACHGGDTLVLGGVQYEDPGTRGFRGSVRQNSCKAPWTPAAWILLPNDTTN